jgi:hypothetical protein
MLGRGSTTMPDFATMGNKDSDEVVEFLTLFSKVKEWGDEPRHLIKLAQEDDGAKRLCERVFWASHRLKMNERRHRQLFSCMA